MKGRIVIAALVLAFLNNANAQPRDGAFQEQRKEDAAGDCLGDPECVRALAAMQIKAAEREAAFESKPWWEKVLPWIAIVGGAFGLYQWVGRAKK